jgi:hypothetical protein
MRRQRQAKLRRSHPKPSNLTSPVQNQPSRKPQSLKPHRLMLRSPSKPTHRLRPRQPRRQRSRSSTHRRPGSKSRRRPKPRRGGRQSAPPRRRRRARRRRPRRAAGSQHSVRAPHDRLLPSVLPIRSARRRHRSRRARPSVWKISLRPGRSRSAGRRPVPIPTTSRHRVRTSPRRADRARASRRRPTRRSRSSSRSAHRA